MTAYSFHREFVPPICLGLGLPVPAGFTLEPWHEPKTHTIRARRVGKARHARAGGFVQLYFAQRRPEGFKMGDAPCLETRGITIDVGRDEVTTAGIGVVDTPEALDQFSRSDGFADWAAMRQFWRAVHNVTGAWSGVIIEWKGKCRP